MTTVASWAEVKTTYRSMNAMFDGSGWKFPENKTVRDDIFLERHLDCAVINTLRQARAEGKKQPTIASWAFSQKVRRYIVDLASSKRRTCRWR